MRIYTLEDIEEILPEVERIVRDMRRMHRRILALSENSEEEIELEDESRNICLRYSFVEGSPEVDELIRKVNAKISLLERANIIIGDMDAGEIEFPSLFQDKRIFYPWRIGMKRITHWYSEDDDYQGKKNIIDLRRRERKKEETT
ncbi:MAG: DUF2203 family protein [DPANN group archaeon]|nr:DUF2203 family protein [DPANN group archaeon]